MYRRSVRIGDLVARRDVLSIPGVVLAVRDRRACVRWSMHTRTWTSVYVLCPAPGEDAQESPSVAQKRPLRVPVGTIGIRGLSPRLASISEADSPTCNRTQRPDSSQARGQPHIAGLGRLEESGKNPSDCANCAPRNEESKNGKKHDQGMVPRRWC